MKTLGAVLLEADQGRCVIEAAWSPAVTQQHDYFHAGCSSALADTAAGYAALSLAPAEATVPTVEFKINLLRPAEGKRLRATAGVLKRGRSFIIVEAKIEALSERVVHCGQMLATIFLAEGG